MAAAHALRDAGERDLEAICRIYAHHVRHGTASFELTPPEPDEIRNRWAAIRAGGLPYIVAESDSAVVGFAYAAQYRPRPAYRHTVEDSVYVAPEHVRRGIGRILLGELIRRCTELGYREMIAVIGDTDNASSIVLHERLGFRHIGVLEDVGFKFGRWLDTVIMQRRLLAEEGQKGEEG